MDRYRKIKVYCEGGPHDGSILQFSIRDGEVSPPQFFTCPWEPGSIVMGGVYHLDAAHESGLPLYRWDGSPFSPKWREEMA